MPEINLDKLEQLAKSAPKGPYAIDYRPDNYGQDVGRLTDDHGRPLMEGCQRKLPHTWEYVVDFRPGLMEYLAVMSPDMVLALIEYIRYLESEQRNA